MYDVLTFFRPWGEALWHGQYTPQYPLPMVGFFAFLALLPPPVAVGLVFALNLILFVVLFKRKAAGWLFYVPVLMIFNEGQLEFIFFWLILTGTPAALALATLKPQLFIFALPKLAADRKLWPKFLLWLAVLYLPITLIRPTWIAEWLNNVRGEGRLSNNDSASLWSLLPFHPPTIFYVFVLGVLAVVIIKRPDWKGVLAAFYPVMRPYDYLLATGTEASAWLIPLSWVCVIWGYHWTVNPWPFAFLGIATTALAKLKWPARPPPPDFGP
jgi:hypothetical protein